MKKEFGINSALLTADMIIKIIIICLAISITSIVEAKKSNKYSKEANLEKESSSDDYDFRPISLKHLDRPFRMAKLNLLWSKAVHVSLYKKL